MDVGKDSKHAMQSGRMMKSYVFLSPGVTSFETKPIPTPGPLEAVVKVRLTSISANDLNIARGVFPVTSGLTLGHEAVGVIETVGELVSDYETGQRVLVSATTSCGQCSPCLSGNWAHCRGILGGWRLGRVIDGAQAEYVRVPHAEVNLTPLPDSISNEDALLLPEAASTGFAAVERGAVELGDNVAVFGQGPVGLCATLGAKIRGAAQIIVIDKFSSRLQLASKFGATVGILNGPTVVKQILKLTRGTGVDVAIEAHGDQRTFENAMRVIRPAGTVSCIGVFTSPVTLGEQSFDCGLGNHTVVNTLCPGGKARMERLIRLVQSKRIDLSPLVTHRLPFTEIASAYEMLMNGREDVVKIILEVAN